MSTPIELFPIGADLQPYHKAQILSGRMLTVLLQQSPLGPYLGNYIDAQCAQRPTDEHTVYSIVTLLSESDEDNRLTATSFTIEHAPNQPMRIAALVHSFSAHADEQSGAQHTILQEFFLEFQNEIAGCRTTNTITFENPRLPDSMVTLSINTGYDASGILTQEQHFDEDKDEDEFDFRTSISIAQTNLPHSDTPNTDAPNTLTIRPNLVLGHPDRWSPNDIKFTHEPQPDGGLFSKGIEWDYEPGALVAFHRLGIHLPAVITIDKNGMFYIQLSISGTYNDNFFCDIAIPSRVNMLAEMKNVATRLFDPMSLVTIDGLPDGPTWRPNVTML